MSDVSCRAFALLISSLERRSIPTARLVDGIPLTLAELRDPHGRVSWERFADLVERFAALVGGPDELRAVGRTMPSHPAYRLIFDFAGLLAKPSQIYWAADRFLGGLLFPGPRSRIEHRSDSRVVMHLWTAEEDRDCPAFFHLTHGQLIAAPEVVGHPPARVSMELRPNAACYTIDILPKPRSRGRRGKARGRGDVRVVEEMAVQLAERQEEIRRWAEDMRQARDTIADQNRQLQQRVEELDHTYRELEESEARWRSLARSAPDFIATTDRHGRILTANRFLHFAPDAVFGRNPGWMLNDEDRARWEAVLERVCQQREVEPDLRVRVVIPGGQERSYSCSVGPVLAGDEVVGATVVARDITARVVAERRARELERRVEQLRRTESLGLQAAGIAHDFNNMLTGLAGNVALLSMDLPHASPAKPHVKRITSILERATELTCKMLGHTGREPIESRPLAAAELLSETAVLLRPSLPGGVEILDEIPPGLPWISGDPVRLQQILLNLIMNAADAIGPDGGQVSLHGAVLSAGPDLDFDNLLAEPIRDGRCLCLTVRDTGRGMDEETRRRIFDPFFSTKGSGRGLGLAAVLGTLRAHGAALELRSRPGEGASFRLLFPVEGGEGHVARGRTSPGVVSRSVS